MKKRPSQGTHRSRPRKGVAVGGWRRLKCQKNGETGFGEDWRRLRSARRRLTSLLVEARHQKVGHVPSHDNAWDSSRRRKTARGRCVDQFLAPVLWEKLQISSLHSWWCGWCRKISPEKSPENITGKMEKCWLWWGFSDHDMADRKVLGDGKDDRNETRSLDRFPELITRINQKE